MSNPFLADISHSISTFHQNNPQGVVIIRGATATGKSALSIELAEKFPVEIISADSRQIFRDMNIGTDKVSKEVREKVAHHQIDIIDPDGFYTAGQWKADVQKLIPEIQSRGNIPLIVGGTGLYIDTIYKNFLMPEVEPDFPLREKWYAEEEAEPGILRQRLHKVDPEEAAKHHPNSTRYIVRALEIFEKTGVMKSDSATEQPVQRPLLMIGLWREKEDTNRRINARIKEMLK